MAAVTLSFSQVGNVWQATTDALGHMVMQIKRKGRGNIKIEQYIDGMDPLPCTELVNKDLNELVPFSSAKGMKLLITSESEVEKAMLMEAVYESSSGGSGPVPGNILTDSDIVNDLNSDSSDKVLSAAQGKALKALIPTSVVKTTDVVNNLTSDDTAKPLSAAQGKELKKQIDAKVIPTAATTAKAGLVKMMTAVTKPADATPEKIKESLEAFIDAAKAALMMQ